MKTLHERLRSERRNAAIWSVLTPVFVLLTLLPFVTEDLIAFEAGMALAFFSLVMSIVGLVMLIMYNKRKRLLQTFAEPAETQAQWVAPDLYGENGGRPIPAYFARQGIFYAGKPYCLHSYDCVITGAQVTYDEGLTLSVRYTIPGSKTGRRYTQVLNIPIPEGRFEEAERLGDYYTRASQGAAFSQE